MMPVSFRLELMMWSMVLCVTNVMEKTVTWIGMSHEFQQQPRYIVMLYTDGLTESMNKDGQLFGE
jgi:hypothetical protein